MGERYRYLSVYLQSLFVDMIPSDSILARHFMSEFNLLCRPLDCFHFMSVSLVDLNQEIG